MNATSCTSFALRSLPFVSDNFSCPQQTNHRMTDIIRSDRKSVAYRRVKLSSGNLINERQLGISFVRAFLHKTSPETSTFAISLAMFIDAISFLVRTPTLRDINNHILSRGFNRRTFALLLFARWPFTPSNRCFLLRRDYWSTEYCVIELGN